MSSTIGISASNGLPSGLPHPGFSSRFTDFMNGRDKPGVDANSTHYDDDDAASIVTATTSRSRGSSWSPPQWMSHNAAVREVGYGNANDVQGNASSTSLNTLSVCGNEKLNWRQVPAWMTETAYGKTRVNGLGEPWNPLRPSFRGIDFTKPDPRLNQPQYEFAALPGEEAKKENGERAIVFEDVRIVDSTHPRAEPYEGDVLIIGNRIIKVVRKGSGKKLSAHEKRGARIIKGRGRTLMSGMVDAHTHFSWTNTGSLDGLGDMPVEEHILFAARAAKTFLDCGYTMCLGAASAKQRIDCVMRDAIYAREIPGPRFLANGREMAPRDGYLISSITAFCDGPEETRALVQEMADKGVDQIKLSMSGEEITERIKAEDTTFTDEMVAVAVETAHANGLRVCAHARSDESVLQCLMYGVDIIYHGSFISPETMDALEAQKDRVFVAPAINWIVSTLYDAGAFGYPPSRAESVGYKRELEEAVKGLKEMRRRGIRVLPGGDYGFAWTPHGHYRDLEHFVNLMGYTPLEAIYAATALGGQLMLRPNDLGKVQPGYLADLILVNGDPTKDVSLLSSHENLDLILINGRIHKETIKDPDWQAITAITAAENEAQLRRDAFAAVDKITSGVRSLPLGTTDDLTDTWRKPITGLVAAAH